MGGVILFGGFNNFYNLLPLLYLKQLRDENNKYFVLNIFSWIICYFLGYIVMILVIYVLGGNWGLEIQSWRHANPIVNLDSLIINFSVVYTDLKSQMGLLGKNFIVVSFALVLIVILKLKNIGMLRILVALILVMTACYAQAIPVGIHVSVRTVFALFLGFLALSFILSASSKTIAAAFLLCLSINLNVMNYLTLNYYTSITNLYRNNLLSIPLDFQLLDRVNVCPVSSTKCNFPIGFRLSL